MANANKILEIAIYDDKELVTYSRKKISLTTDDFKKLIIDNLNIFKKDNKWEIEMIRVDYSACVGRIIAWTDNHSEQITIKNI